VPLKDTEQIDHITGAVIDHLRPGRLPAPEEHTAHANKWLGIGLVLHGLDHLDQKRSKGALAANPCGRRLRVGDITQRFTIYHFQNLTTQSQRPGPAGYGCDGYRVVLSDGSERKSGPSLGCLVHPDHPA